MNSLSELNNYSNELISYDDGRESNVIFDRSSPLTQTLSVGENQTFRSPTGIEIVEIIDYDLTEPSYVINLSSITGSCNVTFDENLPAGVTMVESPSNVFTISPINAVNDWEIVRNAYIQMPFSLTGYQPYTASINYKIDGAGSYSKSWNINLTFTQAIYLSQPSVYTFTPSTTASIPSTSIIVDEGDFNPVWTMVITPVPIESEIVPISDITSSGSGGTYNYNSTTKVITITGSKLEINSYLSTLSIEFTEANADFYITYSLTNSLNANEDSVGQSLNNYYLLLAPINMGSTLQLVNPLKVQLGVATLNNTFTITSTATRFFVDPLQYYVFPIVLDTYGNLRQHSTVPQYTAMSADYMLFGLPYFGAINGDMVGRAYVYNRSTGGLLYTIDNPNTLAAGASYKNFGNSVAIEGNYGVVRSADTNAGNNIFVYNLTTGALLYGLTHPRAGYDVGDQISITSEKLIVISTEEIKIYNISNGSLIRTIINPQVDYYQYLYSLDSYGDYLIVGVPTGNPSFASLAPGIAYIFRISTGELVYTLNNPNPTGVPVGDRFGESVSINENYAVVGVRYEDDTFGRDNGKVYIFNLSDGTLRTTLNNPNLFPSPPPDEWGVAGDKFGSSVKISNSNIVLITAPYEDRPGYIYSNKGVVYRYDMNTSAMSWYPHYDLVAFNAETSIDIDNNYFMIGNTLYEYTSE
jgi:hypothetical protein